MGKIGGLLHQETHWIQQGRPHQSETPWLQGNHPSGLQVRQEPQELRQNLQRGHHCPLHERLQTHNIRIKLPHQGGKKRWAHPRGQPGANHFRIVKGACCVCGGGIQNQPREKTSFNEEKFPKKSQRRLHNFHRSEALLQRQTVLPEERQNLQ